MDQVVITIARQYGSGGRTVGKMLAERLGISFYDKQIIQRHFIRATMVAMLQSVWLLVIKRNG